jgi:hypothetical protein
LGALIGSDAIGQLRWNRPPSLLKDSSTLQIKKINAALKELFKTARAEVGQDRHRRQ